MTDSKTLGHPHGQCWTCDSTRDFLLGLNTLELNTLLHLRICICRELRQLVASEGRTYIQYTTIFFGIFCITNCIFGRALFSIYKTDYKEYRGPHPADRTHAADQWQTCID